MSAFRTLDHADVKGKRVLVRVDLNVPVENGVVSDGTRIERMAHAITEIADKGAKVILLSHFGRPKGRDPKNSLKPVAAEVAHIIKRPVKFVDDCIGEAAERAVAAMKNGDIVCLENTRFHPGEEKNDPAFVAALAKLGDIFVNDAFSVSHRAHASTEGLAHVLPAYAGRTLQAELEAFEKVLDKPARPLAAIVGGAKISTKLDLLGNLLKKVDVLIIGGAMANTFLLAQGKNGRQVAGRARSRRHRAEDHGRGQERQARDRAAGRCGGRARNSRRMRPRAWSISTMSATTDMILDIGPRSVEQVVSVLARSKTLVWNGPFGAFEMEPFDNGTVEVAEAAAELTAAGKLVSVAGGGDTVAALNVAGVTDRLTYVSTAGGAFLEWLEGKALPGVEVLRVK